MLESIEKLLILQDRDRKIRRTRGELAHIEPERQNLLIKVADAQKALDTAKERVKQLESDRKGLELEVEAKKQLISKYGLQQFQTRKNEEYRALTHEMEVCKQEIHAIEDRELELMEQAEAAQRDVSRRNQALAEVRKLAEDQISQLGTREQELKRDLEELQINREELATAAGDVARSRYERLAKNKGENVVVGVQHGVCGGCHRQLSRAIVVACQGDQEIVSCPNCNRILFWTPDMDVAVAD